MIVNGLRFLAVYSIHAFRFINYLFKQIFLLSNFYGIKRSAIEFEDFLELKLDITIRPDFEYFIDNRYYGNSQVLKDYCSAEGLIKPFVEHGLFLGDFIALDEFRSFSKSIIVMGGHRKRFLNSHGISKNVIPIGPYIHYATSIHDTYKFEEIKSKYGKVLLLFPEHSTKLSTNGDALAFIDLVRPKFSSFDTIIACIYYLDTGKKKIFENNGILCTTAGFKFDNLFLPRLRALIELSDFIISETIGTHVGYCVFLNKPIWVPTRPFIKTTLSFPWRCFQSDQYPEMVSSDVKILLKAFSNESGVLDESAFLLVKDFWGFDFIRSKSELCDILFNKKL